jgi:hypothetical protein
MSFPGSDFWHVEILQDYSKQWPALVRTEDGGWFFRRGFLGPVADPKLVPFFFYRGLEQVRYTVGDRAFQALFAAVYTGEQRASTPISSIAATAHPTCHQPPPASNPKPKRWSHPHNPHLHPIPHQTRPHPSRPRCRLLLPLGLRPQPLPGRRPQLGRRPPVDREVGAAAGAGGQRQGVDLLDVQGVPAGRPGAGQAGAAGPEVLLVRPGVAVPLLCCICGLSSGEKGKASCLEGENSRPPSFDLPTRPGQTSRSGSST